MSQKDLDRMKDEFVKSIPQSMMDELEETKRENFQLKKTLEEYGVKEYSVITEVEYICTKGIEDLKKLANTIGLSQDDVKNLDLLHKNLRIARGKVEKKDLENKEESAEELLSIVKGGKS